MSIAAQIFSEQDWPKFHKDLLIKGLSDDKIESYCDYMLTEFDSGFDGHLNQCLFEDDLQDNFSRITSANLESDYRTVVYFFFFQYHTKSSASLDILAIDDRKAQKWLHELLDYVNDSADWGKYELYELTRTHSTLNEILFSKETGEYIQEKTATEEELRMIDELGSIYAEKYDLLEQYDDDKHRRECHAAENDLNDIIERVHKRIKYVEVEDEIVIPAMYILKEYALNARITFDIESVQTSILKINHWLNNNDIET